MAHIQWCSDSLMHYTGCDSLTTTRYHKNWPERFYLLNRESLLINCSSLPLRCGSIDTHINPIIHYKPMLFHTYIKTQSQSRRWHHYIVYKPTFGMISKCHPRIIIGVLLIIIKVGLEFLALMQTGISYDCQVMCYKFAM